MNKNYKRVLSLLLIIIMSISILTACGKKDEVVEGNKEEIVENKEENKDEDLEIRVSGSDSGFPNPYVFQS